jgi:hypothetical protein
LTTEMMTRFVEGRPFIPFEIVTADGRAVQVPHPEFISLERFATAITVFEFSGPAEIFDTGLIVSIRSIEPLL